MRRRKVVATLPTTTPHVDELLILAPPRVDSILVMSDHGGDVILVDETLKRSTGFAPSKGIRIIPDPETSQERRAKIREIVMARKTK